MINIHLLVDESYIEELMMNLPKDKVRVVEREFEENKVLLQEGVDKYMNKDDSFISYKDSVKQVNTWLEEKK